MKRIQLFLVGAFMAVGTLFAQSADEGWQSGVTKVKELIQTHPEQASEEASQLIKGKNKKNTELLVAIARVYWDAGKTTEATEYLELAKKVSHKSPEALVLEGDMAVAKKDAGTACQLYEQAIYFDPNYKEAYLKFADMYKAASPQLAIEKLEQLKTIDPASAEADKKLAEIYYMHNQFTKAAEAYSHFVDTPMATEDDLMKYSFALFLNHDFEKSLQIAVKGHEKNKRHAAFNRLIMYNNTDLKHYDEAMKAANEFFNASDKADYSYLDYMYYGHLLGELKRYEDAVVQYEKAIQLDPEKTDLWSEISSIYEDEGEYGKAADAYLKYYVSLNPDKKTPDLQFQLGKLYYEQGAQSDTLTVSLAERKAALASADSTFALIARDAPDSYLGNFWRARTNSALDPETTQGLAKPYYEEVAALLVSKNDPRYNSALIECYSYLGYYYLVANKLPESKDYWNKILAIDPANATAKRALDGIK